MEEENTVLEIIPEEPKEEAPKRVKPKKVKPTLSPTEIDSRYQEFLKRGGK